MKISKQNNNEFKEMKKTEQADRTNVLNIKTSRHSNHFEPLFIQNLNDNQEIKVTSHF